MELIWLVAFLMIVSTLNYQRASRSVWTLSLVVFLSLMSGLSGFSRLGLVMCWAIFFIIFVPLYYAPLRYFLFSRPILNFYRKVMPTMSRTESEALAAGTVGWEGELFKGKLQWDKLLAMPKPLLTEEEQAFLEGPVEELCRMIDDWDITRYRMDLPLEIWNFLKEEGFFSLIIPKEYGGKAFSAYANSQILTKVYGCSASVATTIGVPNSLGPAELLLHYGTTEQKNYYLPRLARGDEIPCFALTGPQAGSDAGAMTDSGVVCWHQEEDKKILGLRLNFNKRYITLAPVASVIGLAFKMFDPDHLLGDKENLGITCALIPRDTAGITIGRRHFPSNVVFQNGPIQGKNVFIPLDYIIGGPDMAGNGWRMLMECLAAGRAITLPASALGGAKVLTYASGAYARIRRQFNVPIGRFEGIEESLAQIAGLSYIMDATRTFTAGMIDQGEKPAVASAITKYHVTELGRIVASLAMDLHGGKAVCLGPKNYLARFYEAAPVAITVEGANILTRCMIIFGQGAMRCHPFIFAEYQAANKKEDKEALQAFDKALMGHLSFISSNKIRTVILGLTNARIAKAPTGPLKYYFQQATRFSAAFALLADASLLILGGALKRKENLSARLGDILSYLYMLTALLKHYYDQDKPQEDLPLVEWTCQLCLYEIQQRFDEILKNFPHRSAAFFLRLMIFPFGKHFAKPSDRLGSQVAKLLLSPTHSRSRLSEGAFISDGQMYLIEDALIKSINAEPIEKIIKESITTKEHSLRDQAKLAYERKIISKDQLEIVHNAESARDKIIAVDDFAKDELVKIKVSE